MGCSDLVKLGKVGKFSKAPEPRRETHLQTEMDTSKAKDIDDVLAEAIPTRRAESSSEFPGKAFIDMLRDLDAAQEERESEPVMTLSLADALSPGSQDSPRASSEVGTDKNGDGNAKLNRVSTEREKHSKVGKRQETVKLSPVDERSSQSEQRLAPDVAQVVEDLRERLEEGMQLGALQLHVFGSAANGFGDIGADIDVAVEILESCQEPSKKETKRIVEKARQALKKSPFRLVREVSGRIQLLTLLHEPSKREIDLSFGNLAPLANTNLLWSYAVCDLRVQALGIHVKRWAKKVGIQGASKGWLSSYDLILMVLFFLQVNGFGLPCLQELYPAQDWNACALQNRNLQHLKEKMQDKKASIEDLVRGFFHFYGRVFRWGEEVVSVRMGKRLPRSDKSFSQLKKLQSGIRLDIEDPFLLSRNLGCHVASSTKFKKVVAKFQAAVA